MIKLFSFFSNAQEYFWKWLDLLLRYMYQYLNGRGHCLAGCCSYFEMFWLIMYIGWFCSWFVSVSYISWLYCQVLYKYINIRYIYAIMSYKRPNYQFLIRREFFFRKCFMFATLTSGFCYLLVYIYIEYQILVERNKLFIFILDW